ncbi:hypothetical protein DL768_003882 [Monosporascus sp. mg162]|nr:hypothetical protein DL768_003882 [Monosporascus sp. mg162]
MDECTLLDVIVDHSNILKNLPGELLDSILSVDPKAILMTDKDDNFLARLIAHKRLDQPKKTELVETVIGFMKRRGQTLRSLGQEAAKFLAEHETDAGIEPDADLKADEPGTKCIQAAFDFSFARKESPLPIPVTLLEQLVSLATSGMLAERRPETRLTPLHQTVDYQLSLYDPKGQLSLAKLLLDKCEETILVGVQKGTKLNDGMDKPKSKLPEGLKPKFEHGYQVPRITGGASSKGDSILEQSKNEETARRVHSTHSGIPNGAINIPEKEGREKEVRIKGGRQRPSIADRRSTGTGASLGTIEVTGETEDKADTTSKQLLKELGLRFLRSTLNPELQSKRKGPAGGAEAGSTSNDTDELDAFFGKEKRNTGKKEGYGTLTKEPIDSYFSSYQYNPVLRHFTLCQVTIQLKTRGRSRQDYTDQLYFLWWLRERGVEKILKVIVDDMAKPHRDDEIEEALAGKGKGSSFKVEVLD